MVYVSVGMQFSIAKVSALIKFNAADRTCVNSKAPSLNSQRGDRCFMGVAVKAPIIRFQTICFKLYIWSECGAFQ